jgi:hypothetical protein
MLIDHFCPLDRIEMQSVSDWSCRLLYVSTTFLEHRAAAPCYCFCFVIIIHRSLLSLLLTLDHLITPHRQLGYWLPRQLRPSVCWWWCEMWWVREKRCCLFVIMSLFSSPTISVFPCPSFMYSDAEIQQQNIAYCPSPETCVHHVEITQYIYIYIYIYI